MTRDPQPADAPRGRRFATTRWSVVAAAAAGRGSSADSARALAELCADYWHPLYAYVRRRGHDPDAARDLTQAFFARLLERNDLAAADPSRGRFRTFLLTALQNFLASEWRRATALKRGGGVEALPLDFPSAERRYRADPDPELDPERSYERRWALGVLEAALDAVRRDYAADGRGDLFDALEGHLGGDGDALPYRELAVRLGRSEPALRQAASRLRRRLRERLRGRIAETVGSEADVDDEIRHLLSAIAGASPPAPSVTSPAAPRTHSRERSSREGDQ